MLVQAKEPADEIDFITNRIEELVKRMDTAIGISSLVFGGDFREYDGRSEKLEENRIPLFLDETGMCRETR